jgi:hypothetical protein
LWLNEGFARFMEHLAVDHIYPHFKIWESFVAEVYAQAQSLDSLESSHPVEVTVHHSSEVNEIFDSISYAKGASLIRQLQAALGPVAFQKGLQNYLKKHAYQNTFSSDLWAALSESSGQDVAALMANWTQKVGYPVLRVSGSEDGVAQRLCLCQERFLANHDQKKVAEMAGQLWTIPVSVASWSKSELAKQASSSSSSASAVVEPHVMRVNFSDAKGDVACTGYTPENVIKVNLGQTGFYRTHLSDALLASLAEHIPALPPVDRLGVLRDAFAMASCGRAPVAHALDLLQHYAKEDNYACVSALSGNLHQLASLHKGQNYHPQLQALVRATFKHAFTRLGWDAPAAAGGVKEDQLQMQFRALVLSMLGNVGGDAVVQQEALERFRRFVADPVAHPLSADLRGVVYALAAKKGTPADHEALLSLYRGSEFQEEKNRVLGVLGLVEGDEKQSDPVIVEAELTRIRWALKFLLSDEVRPGNIGFLMSGIGASARGRTEAWKWFVSNFDTVHARYCKGQNFIISGLLNGMLGGASSAEFVAEFSAFFDAHPIPQASRTLKNLSEAIITKANRLAREADDVKRWLEAHPQKE